MGGGGRCPRRCRRRTWIRRRQVGVGSKLGSHSGENKDFEVNPGSSGQGDWICVRGHRIKREGRIRVDAKGNVYVPDSEEEESGMEVEAGGVPAGDSVSAGAVQMAAVADGFEQDGINVPTEGVPADAVEVAAEGIPADVVKVAADSPTGEEMHPKVAARLKLLLAQMDPAFHDVFVSMYKVMVPAFFKP